jgi:ankyrin repeat protein
MSNVNKDLFQELKQRNPDIEKITYLINNPSFDINYEDRQGKTLLMLASEYGLVEVVKMLLTMGANPNDRNSVGRTPIMFASVEGHKEVVELLLSSGANPNDKDKYGNSPILWASGNGHKEVVELLLSNGANPNDKDDLKNTPIMLASKKNYLDIVLILLIKGANIPENIDELLKNPSEEIKLFFINLNVNNMFNVLIEKGMSKEQAAMTAIKHFDVNGISDKAIEMEMSRAKKQIKKGGKKRNTKNKKNKRKSSKNKRKSSKKRK